MFADVTRQSGDGRWAMPPWAAVVAIVVGLGAGCASSDPGVNGLASAKAAIGTLKMQLKQKLQMAMAEGPDKALEVCAVEAQVIRAKVSHESGVALGRSSLRPRTPADAAPDWVKAWLDEQGERKVAGVVGFSRVDETSSGKVARVLEPIGIEKGCLGCHGPADAITPGVRDLLAKRYPTDAAIGYAEGDLRGAFWAELPIR